MQPDRKRRCNLVCASLRGQFRASLPWPPWGESIEHGVAVLLVDLNAWSPWLVEASLILDTAETVRVHRRRHPRLREKLTLAYALHRLALAEIMDVPPKEVRLHRDHRGRPWLSDRGLQTSLSHGGGMLALAFSALGPVGIDIEPASRSVEMLEIAPLVCHPNDFPDGQATACEQRLLELWVRKEAMLKAVGIGLTRTMASFAATADTALMLHRNSRQRTTVHMLDAGPDSVAAVAVPEHAAVLTYWLRPPEEIPRPD